jgi:hypothetical protein
MKKTSVVGPFCRLVSRRYFKPIDKLPIHPKMGADEVLGSGNLMKDCSVPHQRRECMETHSIFLQVILCVDEYRIVIENRPNDGRRIGGSSTPA